METKYKIHAFYVLFILVTTIVVLLSVKWGDIPSLVQYFSFALTMSSLLLAILAIIYSFYSNSSNSQNVSVLNNLSQQIAQSASLVSFASDKISQQVEILPSHLMSVQEKVEETQNLIKEYAEQASSITSKKVSDPSMMPPKMAEDFLTISSLLGLELLYAFELGLLKHKEFTLDLEDFCSSLNITSKHYLFGFAIALLATGVFSGSTKKRNINVTSINPHLKNKIKQTLISRAEKSDKDIKQKKLADIEAIEKYIASK